MNAAKFRYENGADFRIVLYYIIYYIIYYIKRSKKSLVVQFEYKYLYIFKFFNLFKPINDAA